MFAEERFAKIIEAVNQQKSVKLSELCVLLDTSESTIRRDLNLLADKGMLIKVHGGAIALNESFTQTENNVEEKSKLFVEEKDAVAKYAASLIEDDDFVFIDAGTTTEKMIDYILPKRVSFVTNGFIHAKKLAQKNFKVYITGGEVKTATEAIVGAECVLGIQKYNFTKCFLGVNGISISGGFSTPDKNEAGVKTAAISRSMKSYVLADHSKFDKISSVTFAELKKAEIITDRVPDKKYFGKTSIKEVV